jgi:uncharacterized protein (DUF433 family)
VQSFVAASRNWGLSSDQIANEYSVSQSQVNEALAFYVAHQHEMVAELESEKKFEEAHVKA